MCVVSMIADHYINKFEPWHHRLQGWPQTAPEVTRAEFDKLVDEIKEMRALLERAADYDKRAGQPDCENDDKLPLLRKIAEYVGLPDAVKTLET